MPPGQEQEDKGSGTVPGRSTWAAGGPSSSSGAQESAKAGEELQRQAKDLRAIASAQLGMSAMDYTVVYRSHI